LRGDQYTFLIVSRSLLFRMKPYREMF